MSILTWENPPVTTKPRPGRPSICASVLNELCRRPNKWAVYPTKSQSKKSKYVIARSFRMYAAKHNAHVEVVYIPHNDDIKIYVRFTGYIQNSNLSA